MRIVYVEDNIANVHLVKRVARMGHHEVINYIDGMDALNNFESDEPDLVLMDIQLAGELTGIEVVKKLREQGHKAPIFAVTAYAMVGDRERCIEAGCTGYMAKPIPIPELVKLFQEYDKPEPVTESASDSLSKNGTSEPANQSQVAGTATTESTAKAEKTETITASDKSSTTPTVSETSDSPSQADTTDEQPTAPSTTDTATSLSQAKATDQPAIEKRTAPTETETTESTSTVESPDEQPTATPTTTGKASSLPVARKGEFTDQVAKTESSQSSLSKERQEGEDKLSTEDSDDVIDKVEGKNSVPKQENNDKHAEMK